MGKAQLILEYFQGKTLEELILEKGQIEGFILEGSFALTVFFRGKSETNY